MFQDDVPRDGTVPFSRCQADMRFPCISVVRAYWEALRNGRDVPYRSEIDPRGIESALEHTFILERIAPRVARFRIAGLHLNDLLGMEVRGMPFTSLFVPEARGRIEAVLARVFDGPETAELTLAAEAGLGRPALDTRLLLLPVRSDLGDISRVLGCLVAEGHIGRTPRRFAVTAARLAALRPSMRPIGKPANTAAGFAEPARPFRTARANDPRPSERPYLRLVVSENQ